MPLEDTQTPKVQYSCNIDLSNPTYNEAPKYPLVQGTSVELYVSVTDNNEALSLSTIDDITAYVLSYCKLDNAPVILSDVDVTLDTEDPLTLKIVGNSLTLNNGKNALVIKYSNAYTTYSTPLYYNVSYNPVSKI